MKKSILLVVTHAIVAFVGFSFGIYMLPILIAPPPPTANEMLSAADQAQFKGLFKRDLTGSDFLHWGEGTISVGQKLISLEGDIAPGPDYKLYLTPVFVQTEDEFKQIKDVSVQVGEVKSFTNFVVAVPGNIEPSAYNAVVIWCESFGQFITAAKYK